MKFSALQRLMKHRPSFDADLSKHYIRLSRDLAVNEEPLFWLQYAIFMKTSGDAAKARMFLDAGYERARKIEGFKTFQLDTQALSIYLLQEIQSKNTSVENLDYVLTAIHTVTDMIGDHSNRYYAIEVIGEIPKFVEVRGKALTQVEKIALVFELNRVSRALESLGVDDKVFSGSDLIRQHIEAGLSTLTQAS